MPSSGDAVSYFYENAGIQQGLSVGDGATYFYENAGVQQGLSAGDSVSYLYENVGFELPIRLNLTKPQIGWGVPLVPSQEVTLNFESSSPAIYSYVNTTPLGVGTYHEEMMARGPIGFWEFEGDYQDSSGHGVTLTPGSGNTFVTTITPTDLPNGKAANFAGIAGYAYSGTPVASVDAITGVFSVAWVGQYDDATVNGHLIGQGNTGGDHFLIRYNPSLQRFEVIWYDGTATQTHLLPTGMAMSSVKAGAIVVDGAEVSLFINGALVSQVPQTSGPVAQAAGRYVCVGCDSATNNRWLGSLDGVGLFDQPLTPDDVAAIATATGLLG